MADQWNRNKQGKIKNIKKEQNKQLAGAISQMQEGQPTGDFQQFRSQADQAVGSTVGDVQRGMAQDQLTAGAGYSGFQQESARQAGDAQTAQTANLLAQYKKQQDQAALQRQQAVQTGLQYERGERRADRKEVVDTHASISGAVSDFLGAVGDIIPT
tara:strand:+ start:630 stop:1100 length:471 start_codon:yes stop_codon:yes gene_type:complete